MGKIKEFLLENNMLTGEDITTYAAENPLMYQHSGDHYKNKAIQPIDYINANGLNFNEGSVIKYVTRHREKNGAADIRKAIHYLEFILHYEYNNTEDPPF